jgi:Uri superfamily endonuclease
MSSLKFQHHNPEYHTINLHHRKSLRSYVLKTAQHIHRLATEHNVGKWHIDLLLGNDRKISKYMIVVTEQRLNKQTCSHGNN